MSTTPLSPTDEYQPDDEELSALVAENLKRIEKGFRDLEDAATVTGATANPVDNMLSGLPERLREAQADDADGGAYEAYVATVKSLLDDQAREFVPDVSVEPGPDGIEIGAARFQPLADIADSTNFLLRLIGSHIGYERKRELVLPPLKAAHESRVDALRHLPHGETPKRRMIRDHAHLLNLLEDTCSNYLKAKDSFSDEVAVGFYTDANGTVRPITVRIRDHVNR